MLSQIIIVALFSFGWVNAFSSGHIFEKVGDWLEERLPEKLLKPLVGCSICNAFWVGTVAYWWIWQGTDWRHWLMVSIAASGFNAIAVNIINKIDAISNPPLED